MAGKLTDVINQFEAKGFRRLPQPTPSQGLYSDLLYYRLSSRPFSWVKYQTLEELAIKYRKLPLVFYGPEGKIEDMGIEPFPPKWLPDDYIGKTFNNHRERLQLSQKGVAYKSGCTVSKYSEYESGVSKPNTGATDRISKVLQITPVYLPDFPAEPPENEKKVPRTGNYVDKIFKPVADALEFYATHGLHPHNARRVREWLASINKSAQKL